MTLGWRRGFGMRPVPQSNVRTIWHQRKATSDGSIDFGHDLWLSCNKASLRPKRSSHASMTTPLNATAANNRESGTVFMPKFDDRGLLTAVVIEHQTRDVLMVAFMDAEAISRTKTTGLAHFHSRSRGRLWLKGETSGNTMKVLSIRVDCDQDALLLEVEAHGPACHTGAVSCFYRQINGKNLEPAED